VGPPVGEAVGVPVGPPVGEAVGDTVGPPVVCVRVKLNGVEQTNSCV
jgi:hypothetical protein